MSGSSRKRISRWDSKEDPLPLGGNARGDDYPGRSDSCFRDKEPDPDQSHAQGNARNGSRWSAADDDEHLKARQPSSEVWPRSRVSRRIGSRSSSRSRSSSHSRSCSRSRSPVHRERRDAGSYNRQKSRTRVSPLQPGVGLDGRYNRGGDIQFDQSVEPSWEARNKRARDSKFYTEDSREQLTRGGRSDRATEFPEDNLRREQRHLHDGASDPFLRRHRNELSRDRETQRRGSDAVPVKASETDFHRSSNIPCKFFASGFCRNGNYCRFSHHGAARASPDRKTQEHMFREDTNHGGMDKFQNGPRWNNFEKSDAVKSNEVETARVSAGISEPKVNGSWIDDMEMSPDWNYGVQTLNKPLNDGRGGGGVSQSSQSLGLKDNPVPAYKHGEANDGLWSHGSAAAPQNPAAENSYFRQDVNRNVIVQKPVSLHHNFDNSVNAAPVQAFNQSSHNHIALPYQNSLAVEGSQVLAMNLPGGLNSSNPENGKEQPVSSDLDSSKVTTEQLNHISNISASLAQFFGNGQPRTQHYSALNSPIAMQVPLHTVSEVYVKQQPSVAALPNQAAVSQNNPVVNPIPQQGNGTDRIISAVAASQQRDTSVPSAVLGVGADPAETGPVDASHKLAENPKVSVENKEIKADDSSKEEDVKKAHEESDDAEDADEDDKADENKRAKDPKGMRAFKFALVECVKEILKPSWREGRMSKDAYKNIAKKVVDKVTGAMQSGNIPQTPEKIDHYLSASKPKLTKLVQAYISKVKKS